MARCRICGESVTAGPAYHAECLKEQAYELATSLCEYACKYLEGELSLYITEETQHEICETCPLSQLMKLVGAD